MAPLPERRVKELAPFEESGVDLMGHFFVKMNGRANHKVWIAVFTCLVTRSVHTELLYNLDADSMINAIVRFAARRPGVRRFTSDQGTNLVGANNVLKKEMQSWNASSTQLLQRRGLEWEFIPASTPHYGGCWERVVGLFKRPLASISSGDVLHVDTFNTAVIEAEGILNRRPLTTLSDDPRDSEPLTPAHILYPATFSHSSASITAPHSGDDATGSRSRWRQAQGRVDAFWKSWSREYLSLLHARQKWTKTQRDLAIDDAVIIVDETLQRHDWKLGRVIAVAGTEPHVRRVDVLRSDGKIVTKDRTKIVLLELDVEKIPKNG